ncbi:MAG: RNA polymerase sigma-I factor [Bacillota bacterium]|nr:RNA polymerase sigma-I factor [Bacillota bacterium]
MDIRRFFNFDKIKIDENINESNLITTLIQIKSGNKTLRNDFISTYKPFILKVTSKTTGKYIDTENCDEFGIGMSAFNEAIDKFDVNKNGKFFIFAQKAIERRVIDYLRKQRKNKEYPFTYFEERYGEQFEERYFLADTNVQFDDIEIMDEINSYKENLKEFQISIKDLIFNTPKHKDSRELCFKIAMILVKDDKLFNYLIKNKTIPRSDLAKKIKVHEKTIGNNRKYIIALCLLMKSNLELSKSYLHYVGKEG